MKYNSTLYIINNENTNTEVIAPSEVSICCIMYVVLSAVKFAGGGAEIHIESDDLMPNSDIVNIFTKAKNQSHFASIF